MTLNLLNKYVHFTKSCSFLIHTGSEDAVWLRKRMAALLLGMFFLSMYMSVYVSTFNPSILPQVVPLVVFLTVKTTSCSRYCEVFSFPNRVGLS